MNYIFRRNSTIAHPSTLLLEELAHVRCKRSQTIELERTEINYNKSTRTKINVLFQGVFW